MNTVQMNPERSPPGTLRGHTFVDGKCTKCEMSLDTFARKEYMNVAQGNCGEGSIIVGDSGSMTLTGIPNGIKVPTESEKPHVPYAVTEGYAAGNMTIRYEGPTAEAVMELKRLYEAEAIKDKPDVTI